MSQSTFRSGISQFLGQREDPFAFGAAPATHTAEALMAQLASTNKTSQEFITFLSNIGVDPTSPVFAPMTMGIFIATFPVWGNLVLSAVFAVTISMVFYDNNYRWIYTQKPGVVHNLCDYVYLAIDVVLRAHREDYPNSPAEPGEFSFNLKYDPTGNDI